MGTLDLVMIKGIPQLFPMQMSCIKSNAPTLSSLLSVCNNGDLGYNEGRFMVILSQALGMLTCFWMLQ